MTEKRGDPRVTRLVVKTLRAVAGLAGQEGFGEKSRVSQAMSRFETGESAPTEAELRRMARAAPLEWPVVVHLLRVFTTVRSAADRLASAEMEAAGGEIADVALDAVLVALAPYLIEEVARPAGPGPGGGPPRSGAGSGAAGDFATPAPGELIGAGTGAHLRRQRACVRHARPEGLAMTVPRPTGLLRRFLASGSRRRRRCPRPALRLRRSS